MISYIKGKADEHRAPLHKLTEAQTLSWAVPEARRMMAAQLVAHYGRGVGVVSATMKLFAYVGPDGKVQTLKPPFEAVERYDLANAPGVKDCPCAGFYDPTSGGPWRARGSTEHHPLCQYDRHAVQTFNLATKRNELPAELKNRPDLWVKLREMVRGG